MSIVEVEGASLYYEVHGDGPPLLLISGLGGDHSAWDASLPALKHYRTVVFDNRGVGRSSKPPGPCSIAQMAADAAQVMDVAAIHSAHVAGLSMGGAIAQDLAIAHPDRVLSLTLVSTWAKADDFLYRLMRSWADAASSCGMTPLWEQLLLWSFSPGLFDARDERLDAMLAGAPRDAGDIQVFIDQAHACIEHDAVDRLAEIVAPTQILVGDTDIYTPERYAQRLHELIRGSSLVRLAGSAHAFPIEEPDVFTSRLIGFLDRVNGTTQTGETR
jgi:pimeloyl-ACP methyl ester carboxylesterase